jgi:dethiobiotin synthetase/adenosylmethionine--8-amino-7-oxononanoate aminotransferase
VKVNYIKPLQCGGSDESFVERHDSSGSSETTCITLYSWKTPASPHLASRWENLPVSDNQVHSSLTTSLMQIANSSARENQPSEDMLTTTIIETAGGALSPSSSSPLHESTNGDQWGWSTQADLYSSLNLPVVFVGDGKLGGISVTLSALEALWNRGYNIDAVVFINGFEEDSNADENAIHFGKSNAEALKEYIMMQKSTQITEKYIQHIDEDAIVLLPPLPPVPIPLDSWYTKNHQNFFNLHTLLNKRWKHNFN